MRTRDAGLSAFGERQVQVVGIAKRAEARIMDIEDCFINRLCSLINEAHDAGLSSMQIAGCMTFVLIDKSANRIDKYNAAPLVPWPKRAEPVLVDLPRRRG